MLSIVLWLWDGPGSAGGKYNQHHVNRAARAIRANLTLEHEIVVITDTPEGDFISDVRPVQLWPDLADRGRCFRRLRFFAPEMRELLGERIAWVDLDCCVTGCLDPIFDRDGDLWLWRSQSTRGPFNGSIVLHTAGSMPEIWTKYSPRVPLKYPGSDQAWLAHVLGERYPLVWTEADGIHAYNRRPRRWRDGPRDGARIIFFPGSVKSNSHICRKFTPWVQKILNQYGDFDSRDSFQWRPKMHRAEHRRAARFTRSNRQGVVARG